jgi:hypothetical protein
MMSRSTIEIERLSLRCEGVSPEVARRIAARTAERLAAVSPGRSVSIGHLRVRVSAGAEPDPGAIADEIARRVAGRIGS